MRGMISFHLKGQFGSWKQLKRCQERLDYILDHLKYHEMELTDPKMHPRRFIYERISDNLDGLLEISTALNVEFVFDKVLEMKEVSEWKKHCKDYHKLVWNEMKWDFAKNHSKYDFDQLIAENEQRREVCLKMTRILIKDAKHLHRSITEYLKRPSFADWLSKKWNCSAQDCDSSTQETIEVKDVEAGPAANTNTFEMCERGLPSHNFYEAPVTPANPKDFFKAVRSDIGQLQELSVSDGIFVKCYQDRMDLFSVMIEGPACTPYEDALFFFDIQFPADYPSSPPKVYFLSYDNRAKINPNLYTTGKVCLSLLGTWHGEKTEQWTTNSNLLQVLISIRSLILVQEPYFNEPGREKYKCSSDGSERSLGHNQEVTLTVFRSILSQIKRPPAAFEPRVKEFYRSRMDRIRERVEKVKRMSQNPEFEGKDAKTIFALTSKELDYPLLPVNSAFCTKISKLIEDIKKELA